MKIFRAFSIMNFIKVNKERKRFYIVQECKKNDL